MLSHRCARAIIIAQEGRRGQRRVGRQARGRGFATNPGSLIAGLVVAAAFFVTLGTAPVHAQAACVTVAECEAGGGELLNLSPPICSGGSLHNRPICSASELKRRKLHELFSKLESVRNGLRDLERELQELRRKLQGGLTPWGTDNPFAVIADIKELLLDYEAGTQQEESILQQIRDVQRQNYSPARNVRDPIDDALRQRRSWYTGRAVEVLGGLNFERTKSSGDANVPHPGFTSHAVAGNIGLKFDLSRALQLSAYERLIAIAGVGLSRSDGSTQSSVSGGFKNASVNLPVGVGYKFGPWYVQGGAIFATGENSFSQGGIVSGSTDNRAWGGEAMLGREFVLWNAKRPDGTVASLIGWRGLMLNLSGHVGTLDARNGSYLDSLGVFHTDTNAERSYVGGDARLTWYYKGGDYWMLPYVSGGYDYAFRNEISGADPALLPFYQDIDKNVWKAEVGVNITSLSQIAVTARAYWRGGDTTQTTGFSLGMKVPITAR